MFPENNLKILIDTGSTKSFIDPDLAYKLYSKCIQHDPFIVSTVFQKSAHKYSAFIPTSKIFKLPQQNKLKFFLFKFHNIFHGLIGLDNLKLLQANLDFDKGLLVTPLTQIKLQYQQIKNELNLISVAPRTEQVISIKTSIMNGEIIIPHQKIHNCEIPECISIAQNGEALTTILNNTTETVTLNFFEPIEVETFERKEIQNINLNNFDESFKQKLDLTKIRTEHLNSEEKQTIERLCSEYSDIFYQEGTPLTFSNQIKHQIKTTDEIPIYTKTYRYPFIHKPEVEKQIKNMIDQKIIRHSNSPWSSPIWIVAKKLDSSGKQKWRVVVDYRKLNDKTIDDRYPLPNITDLLDKLGRCQYFTTLDLASGFHQIEMDENDIAKTAFTSENGHYEYLRMPFGLKNAPATFQRIMDNILRGIQNEKCLVYLDDIIIFSTSLQEHVDRLREVFKRLRETNFKIQLDKSEFLRKEVAYLGHLVTQNGVKPNPDKIKAIKNYPIPSTTKQIKGFLGLLGYYRRFINNFAKITKPLTKCLKKGAKIVHDDEFKSCFDTCKNLLINEPILQYPDFTKVFNLTTDASNVAIGAILSQGPIGKDLPVAYASRTLNDSEQHYSTTEKELLAIVWATKYFRPYLFGRKFNIITDHKPLQWLFSLKDPSSKLVRWRIKLEEYDYHIIYKKGKLNTNADALSRIELHTKETNNIFDYMDKFNYQMNTLNQPSKSQNDNVSIQVIPDEETLEIDDHQIKTDDDITIHTNAEENPIVQITSAEIAVNYGLNQIIINSVLHSPAKAKIEKLFENKQRISVQISNNQFEQDIIEFIKTFIVPNIQYHLYFENPDIYEPFCEVIRKHFKWPSLRFKKCKIKLIDVTNNDDIKEIIQNYHEGKTNHRGIQETEQRIKKLYYWPIMKKSIQTFINDCEICQQSKYERNPIKIQMNITPTASKPFEIIHLDTFTFEQNKFLTIIDTFSKYAQAYSITSLVSTQIVDNLIQFFSHHGVPKQIITDNGTEFKNTIISDLLNLHKIKIHFCSPNHPQSNSPVERLHSTLIEHMRLLNTQGFKESPTKSKMTYAILAYNHSIHSVTKLKPIDVINGHIINENPFDIDINKLLLNNYINDHKEKTKLLYSKINQDLIQNKEKVITKLNENRDDPKLFQTENKTFTKNFKRQKNANKFNKPTTITNVNETLKTVATQNQNKVHMDNLKRPLKTTYKFNN